LLSHQSHDPNREPVRVWHVDRNELHASFLQAQQEVRIAAQSVELGDDELRVVGAAGFERFVESRPIIGAFAALDLNMLFDKLPPPPFSHASTDARWGLQAKAAFAFGAWWRPEDRRRIFRDVWT
jgi:hypothetical protein